MTNALVHIAPPKLMRKRYRFCGRQSIHLGIIGGLGDTGSKEVRYHWQWQGNARNEEVVFVVGAVAC